MRIVMRALAIAAGAALVSFAAGAQVPDPAAEAGRFTVAPEGDGFLRLDTHSGAVSHCRKDASGTWVCVPMAEAEGAAVAAEIAALDRRLAALAAEIDTLRRDIARLQARVGIAPPVPSAPATRLAPDTPDEIHTPGISDADRAELERALGFMEILMRRFSNLVGEMKRETGPQKE